MNRVPSRRLSLEYSFARTPMLAPTLQPHTSTIRSSSINLTLFANHTRLFHSSHLAKLISQSISTHSDWGTPAAPYSYISTVTISLCTQPLIHLSSRRSNKKCGQISFLESTAESTYWLKLIIIS